MNTKLLYTAILTLILTAWLSPRSSESQNTEDVTLPVPQVSSQQALDAVDRGLAFLASEQQENGSWLNTIGYKLNLTYRPKLYNYPHVGVTALACMAFMAGGSTPGRGPYGQNVADGLGFVLDCVNEDDGFISYGMTRMYSHAFATLFLAEVYGMTKDERIKPHLERAVQFITSCQNEEGAWRYVPHDLESDMSITVCQLMALRAAQHAGVRVRQVYIDAAVKYIKDTYVPVGLSEGVFKYQNNMHARYSFALTGAGVTALQFAGIYNTQEIPRGLGWLRNNMPYSVSVLERSQPRFDLRYFYGHYYSALAFYFYGDEALWKEWIDRVERRFVLIQKPGGYWEDDVGRNYSTAMACLILQISKRLLPIFQR
ncbi:MAG: terpene cyclase/mutase family protein [Planctomycetes bacterium]|nr:terpene cyclase/mutase family protein [Planctomycetota bacterium]